MCETGKLSLTTYLPLSLLWRITYVPGTRLSALHVLTHFITRKKKMYLLSDKIWWPLVFFLPNLLYFILNFVFSSLFNWYLHHMDCNIWFFSLIFSSPQPDCSSSDWVDLKSLPGIGSVFLLPVLARLTGHCHSFLIVSHPVHFVSFHPKYSPMKEVSIIA